VRRSEYRGDQVRARVTAWRSGRTPWPRVFPGGLRWMQRSLRTSAEAALRWFTAARADVAFGRTAAGAIRAAGVAVAAAGCSATEAGGWREAGELASGRRRLAEGPADAVDVRYRSGRKAAAADRTGPEAVAMCKVRAHGRIGDRERTPAGGVVRRDMADIGGSEGCCLPPLRIASTTSPATIATVSESVIARQCVS
jgi:hypothetical protein